MLGCVLAIQGRFSFYDLGQIQIRLPTQKQALLVILSPRLCFLSLIQKWVVRDFWVLGVKHDVVHNRPGDLAVKIVSWIHALVHFDEAVLFEVRGLEWHRFALILAILRPLLPFRDSVRLLLILPCFQPG